MDQRKDGTPGKTARSRILKYGLIKRIIFSPYLLDWLRLSLFSTLK